MRLDELTWVADSIDANATILARGNLWRIRHWIPDDTYCMGVWHRGWEYENLDPFAAQAVLYHFLKEVSLL